MYGRGLPLLDHGGDRHEIRGEDLHVDPVSSPNRVDDAVGLGENVLQDGVGVAGRLLAVLGLAIVYFWAKGVFTWPRKIS